MAFKIKANIPAASPSVDPKPAAKHFDIVLGLDFHVLKVPVLIPCPVVPFSGLVFDPMDYIHCTIPAMRVYEDGEFTTVHDIPMGGTVLINGFYRAGAQTALWGLPSVPPLLGKAKGLGSIVKTLNLLHFVIPQPLFLLPRFFHPHEGQLSHGSKTVLTQQKYQSTLMCRAYSCQDVGKVLLNNPTGGLYLNYLTAIVAVMPMGRPVIIGGPKEEQALKFDDLMNALLFLGVATAAKGALLILGKLGARLLSKIKRKPGFQKFRNRVQARLCSYLGEPVDAASGHMASQLQGFSLPGPIPFNWEANYYSDSHYNGPLGKNMYHSYDISLMVDEAEQMVLMNDSAGRPILFPILPKEQKFFNPKEKYELHRSQTGEYFVADKTGLFYYFNEPLAGSQGHGQLRSIVNREGFAICFDYNAQGHLIQITDSAKRLIRVDNNSAGQITALHLPHPQLGDQGIYFTPLNYDYDDQGRMIQLRDAENHSNHFQWNNRLITARQFNNGVTFTFEYDTQERCRAALGPNGLFSYRFEYLEGCTIVTNAVGTKKQYYHKEGIVTRILNSQGAEQLFTYDEYSNLIAQSNESGQLTSYRYDDRGNTIQMGLPGQGTVAISYNEQDNPLEVVLPNGALWQYDYNEQGKLIKRTNPENAATHYDYRADGMLYRITNTLGVHTTLQYNNSYLINRVLLPNGSALDYQYDDIGRCIQIHSPGGTLYRWYDMLGNMVRMDSPDGNRTDIRYDSMGNAVHVQDEHTELGLDYNFFGKLTRRMQGGANIWFQYNLEGELTQVINEHQERYLFELDSEGNVVAETGFDGFSRQYLRDKAGRLIQLSKPDGSKDGYEYNAAGQIITIYHHADGSSEQYDYNSLGLLTKALNADAEVLLQRDRMGRILKETCKGQSVSSQYNVLGSRSRIHSSLGADIALDYDPIMGTLTRMDANGWEAQMQYNAVGQETQRALPGGISRHQQFDRAGRLQWQSITSPQHRQHQRRYSWDIDRLIEMNDSTSGQKVFNHDIFGNLSEVIYGDGTVEYRLPDAMGNLFETKQQNDRKYGKGGQLQESQGYRYKYDKLGNLIEKKAKKGYEKWQYQWNAAGMLAAVTRPEGATIRFKYDALGRRIEKQYKKTVTKWLWDGHKPLHEWKEFDAKESSPDELITWVFEEGNFTPAAKLKGDKKYSILADHLGTPLKAYTAEGSLIWQRELDSYGNAKMLQGDAGFCHYLYPGQCLDAETGLAYNRFRYYDPAQGNYISQDPIGLEGGNPTLYGYVKDPNTWIDVLGLDCGKGNKAVGGTVDFVAGVEARSFGKVVGEGTIHVKPTINAIESGALKPRNAFGYLNKEGHTLLNGKPAGYWQEYHMLNFGSKSPLRILRGGQGEYFLSPDHYKSIIPLNR